MSFVEDGENVSCLRSSRFEEAEMLGKEWYKPKQRFYQESVLMMVDRVHRVHRVLVVERAKERKMIPNANV